MSAVKDAAALTRLLEKMLPHCGPAEGKQMLRAVRLSQRILKRLEVPELPGMAEKPTQFEKPTLDQVQCFCAMVNVSRADAEWFWHKCEGCGWKNSGKAIVDWKATIRAWKLACYFPNQRAARVWGNGEALTGADKMIFQKEFERVEASIRTIKMGQEGLRGLSAADCEQLKAMHARRTELRKLLGVTI
jgi:hypothetical protein